MNVRHINIWKDDKPVTKIDERPKFLTGYEYHTILESFEVLIDTECMTMDEYSKIRYRMDGKVKR